LNYARTELFFEIFSTFRHHRWIWNMLKTVSVAAELLVVYKQSLTQNDSRIQDKPRNTGKPVSLIQYKPCQRGKSAGKISKYP